MRRNENGYTIVLYIVLVFLAVALCLLLVFNYQANTEQMAAIAAAEEAAMATPTPTPTSTPEPTPTPTRITQTVTLAFAGDIVAQSGLTSDAQVSDGYDYSDELTGAAAVLNSVDFAACTMVGTIMDKEEFDAYELAPSFASDLKDAGFDLVNTATDRILENDLDGLKNTVSTLSDAGLETVGAYGNSADSSPVMVDVDGVNVAFLSYTYGTNGVSVVGHDWCVDLLTTDYMTTQETVDYDTIDSDIGSAKANGADIIVCFLYWWDNTQYYAQPRSNQQEVVDYLLENGVDIIIGGGVKTPQPIEARVVEREDGTRANCVVCYSLSNLMSCLTDVYTDLSAVAYIQLSRDIDTGEVWISGVSYSPLFMLHTDAYSDYEDADYRYRVLDAYSAITAYEAGLGGVSALAYADLVQGVEDLQTLLGAEYDTMNGGVTMEYPY